VELKKLFAFIHEQDQEVFTMVEEIVNIDSPSHGKEGTNQVGAVLCRIMDRFEIPYDILSNEKQHGDHIIASIKGTVPGKILMMGHRDTVFQEGTAKQRPFTMDEVNAYGPGVSDMKSGLITMLLAAAAVKQSGLPHYTIELLFTPDEEIGSPTSRALIQERAKEAIAVFNLEPGRPDGSVVTGRKGSAHLKLQIQGKAAHSGVNFEEGISAIEELGHKIVALGKLTDLSRGITVNVGTIQGGINTNVIAPEASAMIHVAFWSVKDFDEVIEKVRTIAATSCVPGTSSSLSGDISFLPMERHEGVAAMYEVVKEAGTLLDMSITEQKTKGASDAGFTASIGVPTICGMGPVGGNWHNEREYMVKDTFIPRIKLLAVSLLLASKRL
jgi:glutamate carboxypeptidase